MKIGRDKVLDNDRDTGFEAEQVADEDKIHGKTGGVECLLFSDVGILTLAKQSSAKAWLPANQDIPTGEYITVAHSTEVWDVQNEFDGSRKTGTDDRANGEGADHLIDDTNHQFEAGDVGSTVWNTTDNTYAKVTAHNDSGDVTLDANIMVNGENYIMYKSRFTAKEAGKYSVSATVYFKAAVADQENTILCYKNGVTVLYATQTPPVGTDVIFVITGQVDMAPDDYLEIIARQNSGITKELRGGAENRCNFIVTKAV